MLSSYHNHEEKFPVSSLSPEIKTDKPAYRRQFKWHSSLGIICYKLRRMKRRLYSYPVDDAYIERLAFQNGYDLMTNNNGQILI